MMTAERYNPWNLTPPPGYPDDCPMDMHLSIERTNKGQTPSRWRCVDCGQEGGPDLLGAAGCPTPKKDCPHCGYGPECALDCKGIAEILSDPDVYVAGFAGAEEV